MGNKSIRILPVIFISILVGVVSGFSAVLFIKGVALCSRLVLEGIFGFNYPEEGESFLEASSWSTPDALWVILPVLIIGSLISGIIVWKLAPETAGPGTDVALRTYHKDEKVRWRTPFIKGISSILTIGSGGSAGCEGPIAQICSGFGALFADVFKLGKEERRIAVAIGIGAGVGAIFKAPIGGAFLAAEILYLRGMKPVILLPALLASLISYGIFGLFEGFTPLFGTTEMSWTFMQLPFFLILGVIAAGIGFLYIKSFYGTRKLFDKFAGKFHIPSFLKPVIGAAIFGGIVVILGYASPETCVAALGCLGTGYGFSQLALYGMLPLLVLILLPFLKILATSLTVGSGASGGVFAPGVSIGAFVGGAVGTALYVLFPELIPAATIPVFVIAGMMATIGSIAHAPIAAFIMILEMTWSPYVFLPALLALIPACLLLRKETLFRQQRISRKNPILPEETSSQK